MKKILLFADGRKARARDTALSLQSWLSRRKIKSVLERSPHTFKAEKLKGVDLVVSLGGDGTILLLARDTAPRGIPILPVDLGGLGFLATCQPSAARRALSRVLAGDYALDERMMLSVGVYAKGRKVRAFGALNEALIHKGASERLVHLRLSIGGREVTTYSADGVIVATPTGSTGYALSAGGPIVSPNLEAFVVAAICPHSLSVRPIVIPPVAPLGVASLRPEREVVLACDGIRSCAIRGEEIRIEKAEERCKLIMIDADFYHNLKKKLQWAGEYKRLDLGGT